MGQASPATSAAADAVKTHSEERSAPVPMGSGSPISASSAASLGHEHVLGASAAEVGPRVVPPSLGSWLYDSAAHSDAVPQELARRVVRDSLDVVLPADVLTQTPRSLLLLTLGC